jgi:hypothetical protein
MSIKQLSGNETNIILGDQPVFLQDHPFGRLFKGYDKNHLTAQEVNALSGCHKYVKVCREALEHQI